MNIIDQSDQIPHENQQYQLDELAQIPFKHDYTLVCQNVVIYAWHTWTLEFNRPLTSLEILAIQHILNADTFKIEHQDYDFGDICQRPNTYCAWWD